MTQKIGLYTKNMNGVWFGVACDDEQVFAKTFTNSEKSAMKSLTEAIPQSMEFQVCAEPSILAEKVLRSAKSVYDGKGETESVPLATNNLSPFTKHVLEVARLIPVGYVTSYGALSRTAGGSPRAVGGVMAANPFAPIVPCHRVVRSDLTLGGYGGGLDLKEKMLVRERRSETLPMEIPVGAKRLQVLPVERVLERT